MIDPLLDGLAQERHQRLLREAEHWRLIKTVTAARPSAGSRILVTLGSWLIQEAVPDPPRPAGSPRVGASWSTRAPALMGTLAARRLTDPVCPT